MSYDILKAIDERALATLIHRARRRAASLKSEARGYWHTNRERNDELRARAQNFKRLADTLEELKDPDALVYPATEETEKRVRESTP